MRSKATNSRSAPPVRPVMTRAAPFTQAVSPTPEAGAAPSAVPDPVSLSLLVDQDNAGRYHWTMITDGGELVRSAGFASYREAEEAAWTVHRGASRASFSDPSGDTPAIGPSARREAEAEGRRGAERWVDEGGSFSSEPVTR